MAVNFQQFGTRFDYPSKTVNEVNDSFFEKSTAELTSIIRQLDAGEFSRQPERGYNSSFTMYDPYVDMYNPYWRDHTDFSYENPYVNQSAWDHRQSFKQFNQPYYSTLQMARNSNYGSHLETLEQYLEPQFQPEPQSFLSNIDSSMSLEDMVKSLAENQLKLQQMAECDLQFQQDMGVKFQDLVKQVGQITTAAHCLVERLEQSSLQTIVETEETANAINLRSIEEVEMPEEIPPKPLKEEGGSAEDEVPKLQDVVELNSMEIITDEHLEKENDKLTMNQELLEYGEELNDQSELQQSGKVVCYVLPISDEEPLPFVLQATMPNLKPLPLAIKNFDIKMNKWGEHRLLQFQEFGYPFDPGG